MYKKLFILLLFWASLASAAPYEYLAGSAPEKTRAPHELTFLQWNICFLPYNWPLLYGGIAEAEERIEKVAAFILAADADVVVLQEAHDEDSVEALASRLGERYPHIYFNIGPVAPRKKHLLNSGLMVMSKYRLTDLRFKPFDYPEMQWQINKGFLSFNIEAEGRRLLHATATHLQPYLEEKDEDIRERELMEIVRAIETDNEILHVVMGDLNIPWGSDEYKESGIRTYFEDAYTSNIQHVDKSNCTATDYLSDFRNEEVKERLVKSLKKNEPYTRTGNNPYASILDYFLVFKNGKQVSAETTLIRAFPAVLDASGDELLNAHSDHNALFSRIFF